MLNEYLEDMSHCLKCGACRTAFGPFMPICPSGIKYGFDSHYAIGRVEIAKAVLDGRLKLDSNLMSRIYTCTSCGGCDQQCGPTMGVFPLRIIEELKYEAVEKGMIPPAVRDFLKNVSIRGNPYSEQQQDRDKWAEGLNVPKYTDQEYLLYVGCVGSYEDRGRKMSKALADVFNRLGVSFGILGNEELCDGNEVHRVGERGLFRFLAEQNIGLFVTKGIRRIVTLSPHAYNAMKREYPKLGGTFEVIHYTELLKQILMERGMPFKKQVKRKITYHDPCFLGRHNAEYESGRKILRSIPGADFVEMEMNKENSFCCGGGGGNFFTDILGGGPDGPARIRVRQALDTGAEVLAVACPNCAGMLDDAVKDEDAEDRIKVKDISQILNEAF